MTKLIYRAIPEFHKKDPFVPSAMFPKNIKILEDRINSILTSQFPSGCVVEGYLIKKVQEIKSYLSFGKLQRFNRNFDHIIEQETLYCFFLSRVNIIISCNRNRDYEILIQSFSLNWFTPSKEDECENGFCKLRLDTAFTDTYLYLKDFPKATSESGYLKLERTWFDCALFQHLNFIYDVPWVSNLFKNIYPTMTMDWTTTRDIIDFFNFGGDNKVIVQMDLDKYISEFQYVNKGEFINAFVFGIASQFNLKDQTIQCFQNSNNNLMVSQKALTIFWPWQYTIQDMEDSEIGKRLDFIMIR